MQLGLLWITGCSLPTLSLVLDPRLSPAQVDQDWATGLEHSEAAAQIELHSANGRILDQFLLEAPLARLDPIPIRGGPAPTYIVTTDLTAPAGSYNGPVSTLIAIVGRHLVHVEAVDAQGHLQTITLAQTGKAAWKKIDAGRYDEFVELRCERVGEGFATWYRRYHPTPQGWQLYVRMEAGFWEADGVFPDNSSFPRD